jgi:hypothetical protein
VNKRRLNITLPKQQLDRLKKMPNMRAFIAEALREKLDAEERAKAADELGRAYRAAAEEEASLVEDWEAI